MHIEMPEVSSMETHRRKLLLRRFRPDDIEAYSAMCADREVVRYLSPTGDVLSREDAWQ
jgi:RimJ/RimL family protein N-acetyltransferase